MGFEENHKETSKDCGKRSFVKADENKKPEPPKPPRPEVIREIFAAKEKRKDNE